MERKAFLNCLIHETLSIAVLKADSTGSFFAHLENMWNKKHCGKLLKIVLDKKNITLLYATQEV